MDCQVMMLVLIGCRGGAAAMPWECDWNGNHKLLAWECTQAER